jgi:hypothetical protein
MPSIVLSWAITKIGAEIRILPYPVSISLPNLLREVGLQRIQWNYKVTFASFHRPKNQGTFTRNPSLSTTLTLRILLQSRRYQDQSTQKELQTWRIIWANCLLESEVDYQRISEASPVRRNSILKNTAAEKHRQAKTPPILHSPTLSLYLWTRLILRKTNLSWLLA